MIWPIFLSGLGQTVPLDPGSTRVIVTFTDSGGQVRGRTSVAVRTN